MGAIFGIKWPLESGCGKDTNGKDCGEALHHWVAICLEHFVEDSAKCEDEIVLFPVGCLENGQWFLFQDYIGWMIGWIPEHDPLDESFLYEWDPRGERLNGVSECGMFLQVAGYLDYCGCEVCEECFVYLIRMDVIDV